MTATTGRAVLPGPPQLAARVLDRIAAGEHDQRVWVEWPGGVFLGGVVRVADVDQARGYVGCGTTACAAGWTVIEAIEAGYRPDPDEVIDEAAARFLDIDPLSEHPDRCHLFSGAATEDEVQAGLAAIADGTANRRGFPTG